MESLFQNVSFWQRRNGAWSIAKAGRSPVHQRQREGDRRSFVRDASQDEPTTMIDGDAASNGETEARASRLARAGLVHPVKAFAKVRQMLDGNADASIA